MHLKILRSQVVIHKLLLLETKDPFDNGSIKKITRVFCVSVMRISGGFRKKNIRGYYKHPS